MGPPAGRLKLPVSGVQRTDREPGSAPTPCAQQADRPPYQAPESEHFATAFIASSPASSSGGTKGRNGGETKEKRSRNEGERREKNEEEVIPATSPDVPLGLPHPPAPSASSENLLPPPPPLPTAAAAGLSGSSAPLPPPRAAAPAGAGRGAGAGELAAPPRGRCAPGLRPGAHGFHGWNGEPPPRGSRVGGRGGGLE